MTSDSTGLKRFEAHLITPNAFAPFGQVIQPIQDDVPYSALDAHLKLDEGIPRFYIMQLTNRGRRFTTITRHQRCTQCLGALAGAEWLMAVAPPGSTPAPDLNAIQAFRIPGTCFVKLHIGTWHAGPFFDDQQVNFYNLELSDTNINDHYTCNLRSHYHVECEIV